MVLSPLAHPIVLAPMAGGPSTPELAVAVTEAGGLGFVAAGYRTAEALRGEIDAVRAATDAPFGVNLFVPGQSARDLEAVRAYAASLGPGAGQPRYDDDGWQAKLAVLRDARVAVASFTFGFPSADVAGALHDAGTEVWVTVTSVAEARLARDAGADVLVAQGVEAGGHRASFADGPRASDLSVLALLRLLAASDVSLPVVATGGIADAAGVAAALAAGASAVQAGTAFLLAPEAGTHPAHRAALGGDRPTALTRAFTGRLARGIVNRFMAEHPDAPVAYPELHHATAPLRAAAREGGDADGFNLWAGQAYSLTVERPAEETVRALLPG
jgi:nitronate monooxygenase